MTGARLESGQRAEARAADFLVDAGFVIVERNFRCRQGELDIIAYDGDCLVFIEVRFRKDDGHGTALEQVGHKKQRQVARVAEVYLAKKRLRPPRCRFDVIGITGDRIEHVRDAFRPS